MTAQTPTKPPRRRSRARRRLTDEERAERRERDRERIAEAVRELRTSEGWQRWLDARARFRRYSAQNCMLIALQCPHATNVAPITTWNALGRTVRRGERAIAINVFAGSFTRERSDGTEDEIPRFRLKACLFDETQTEGEPLPEPPGNEPIDGDSHQHHLAPLTQLAGELGYEVRWQMVPGRAGGYCDYTNHLIVVDDSLAPNARVRVLVHEIAHALGISSSEYGRAQAETLVESITYIVCGSIGLDTSKQSVPYVAGWDDSGDLAPLQTFAQTIDQHARRIEDTLLGTTDTQDGEAGR